MIVGLTAYAQAKKIVVNNVSEASYQTVRQVANNMNVVLQTFDDLSLQIIVDTDIRTAINKLQNNQDNFLITRDIIERLNNYLMTNDKIKGIALIPSNPADEVISAGTINVDLNADAVQEKAWYNKTLEASGKSVWIAPEAEGLLSSGSADTFGLGRLLTGFISEDHGYTLLMDMNVDAFFARYDDVQLGEGSQLTLVDSEGNVVMAKDLPRIGAAFNVTLPSEGKQAEFGQPKLTDKDGHKFLAAYQKLESSDWRLVGTIPVANLYQDAKVIQTLTWVMVLFAMIIAIIIGYMVIATIANPLVKLRNLMVEGANGNLTVRSTIRKRQDEIGQLADSFNEMMSQITSLAKQTTRSADEVLLTAADLTDASNKTSIAAKEIAVATEEIANGATSLAVEAEKGSDLTNHINRQMKQVMDANEQMSESATEVEKASRQGTAYMGILTEKTGITEDMTRSMVAKVDALKESTGSIVKILDVLDNLTKQTNILSLNATIEAARAGAAGKGFMVVADEIRKLADQSRQSIDVVGQITEKIQGEIEETVKVLSDAYPLFQEQIVSVKDANEIFLKVQMQMGQFVDKLGLATEAIGGLNQSQAVLSDAMTSVSAVAEQSSATSEEVASLSSEQLSISNGLVRLSDKLDAVSKGLKESLMKFKVE
ncbi:methyl-accepting chemotaxis protein [Paenibacillus sp. HB172176]|uniref:methyl-accepting chemotaxis protein n=1 Tax=Paenibacillus sp. HB172176 TaxID=2493690 RepID=UPI001F0F4EAF|nr:methyl-accepting chemotaxis protein [Paenibacillus sp. HB172176]